MNIILPVNPLESAKGGEAGEKSESINSRFARFAFSPQTFNTATGSIYRSMKLRWTPLNAG